MIFQVSCFIPGPSPLTPSASSSSSRNSCSSMRPQSSACRAASSLKSEKNKSTAPIRIATWSAPPNHDARIRIFKRGQLLGQLKKKNQLKKTYGRLGRRIAAGSLQDHCRIAAGSLQDRLTTATRSQCQQDSQQLHLPFRSWRQDFRIGVDDYTAKWTYTEWVLCES